VCGAVSVLKLLCEYLDALVHPTAQLDPLTAARHRAFMAPRLLGSLVTLVALPAYLALRGAPSVTELLVFCWLLAPILSSYYLSQTGRYASAHMLSSLALAGLVTIIAAKTGGIGSFAAIWLILVPLEAGLSRSLHSVAAALTLALVAAAVLLVLGAAALLPAPEQGMGALAVLGFISASFYGTGLALAAGARALPDCSACDRAENHYRRLAHSMPDAISRHGRNGSVLFMSPAVELLLGASVAELRGQGLFDRVHVADRLAYMSALADTGARGEPHSAEFRVRRHTGDPADPIRFIWIEMRCRPLASAASADSDNPREVVAVLRDVTDRKAAEHGLEESRAEAERRTAVKIRSLAVVGHELRTPLNAIIGFSSMLADEPNLPLPAERRQEYAKLINESGNHLLAVVNDILVTSKLETGDYEIRPEPVALAAAVGACCELLALDAHDSGVRLAVDVEPGLPPITVDKRALKQILINLLSNAIKFTDRGGHITVGAKCDGANVLIAVEDDGIGIAEDDLPRLGDPFFRSGNAPDRRCEGTGLGLSIVKALIGLHGGELKIASRIGDGTRVVVRLPLDCESAKAAKPVTPVKSSATITRLATAAEAVSEATIPVKKRA